MASIVDKLLILPKFGLVFGKTTLAALTGPFRGAQGAPTYGDHVLNTLIREVLLNLSIKQIQWVTPTFVSTYQTWCKGHSLAPDVVDIPGTSPSVQGFWIGSKSTAKYTMVYYHGGGFVVPGSDRHLDMLLRFVEFSNNNLAIFAVAYTLSPQAVYPTAIGQSVEALRYVVNLPGHSSNTTLIGGDSAGGNLAVAVLSHISGHPHPQSNIVKRLDISSPLKGAVLIAPWVSSDSSKYPSMTKYQHRDIVNKTVADYWIEAYKGEGKKALEDEYIWAATATPEWWKDAKAEHVLSLAGEHEVLVDGITAWVDNYKAGAGADKIKYVIGEREIHDQPMNPLPMVKLEELGDKSQEGAIRLWIKERLT